MIKTKKSMLFTIIVAGAIAGIFAWAFYSGVFFDLAGKPNSFITNYTQSKDNQGGFAPLTKTESTPVEVNDSSLKELDNYMKNIDSTESEDLSDLE